MLSVFRMFCFGVLLVLLFGGSVHYLLPMLDGAVFTYIWVTAIFAFTGWCTYNTYQEMQEDQEYPHHPLDVGNVLLIITVFIATIYFIDLGWSVLVIGLFFGVGSTLMGIRRRFFPSSTVPFHPKNLALRITSIFCALHALATLCFALVGPEFDQPSSLTLSFSLLGGALLAVAAWTRRLELLRYSSLVSEDDGEP